MEGCRGLQFENGIALSYLKIALAFLVGSIFGRFVGQLGFSKNFPAYRIVVSCYKGVLGVSF